MLNENNETDRGRNIQQDEKSQATAHYTIDAGAIAIDVRAILAAFLFPTDRFHCGCLHVRLL